MKNNGTRASFPNTQALYIRTDNRTSEEIVIFRFYSQYAYHSDGLCSMWEKNIRSQYLKEKTSKSISKKNERTFFFQKVVDNLLRHLHMILILSWPE